MTPRDRGTHVVQVGSALAERSVPSRPSALRGQRHPGVHRVAALRAAARPQRGAVTMVQMPGSSTPRTSWVLTRLPRHPRPVAPSTSPRWPPRAVLAPGPSRAAHVLSGQLHRGHPAGPSSPRACSTATWPAPATTASRRTGPSTLAGQPLETAGRHRPDDYGARGIFDDEAAQLQFWISRNRRRWPWPRPRPGQWRGTRGADCAGVPVTRPPSGVGLRSMFRAHQ